jgi:formylglycine-generating enzyme
MSLKVGFAVAFALAIESTLASNAVRISGGKFTPLYGFGKKEKREYLVGPFYLDRFPVTRNEFVAFIRLHPEWNKAKINSIYADENYLKDLKISGDQAKYPVTYVSWFAAQAFCEHRGGRLPSVLEWELAASASRTKENALRDPMFVEEILKWYSSPSGNKGLRAVGMGAANFYGVHDLHGLIWEWTVDFNSVFVTGDNRQDGDKSAAAVCGAGATGASNRSDYAAFMRYAMRSSVEARFAQPNLGFRCAYDDKR